VQGREVNQVIKPRTFNVIDAAGSVCNIAAMYKAVPYQRWFIRAQVIEQIIESLLQAVRFIITDMFIAKVASAAIGQKQAGF
jgi:hypothetical protein